jgi:hypothetical protein
MLTDAVRGTNKLIYSNSTSAENTETNYLKTFTSDGFTVGTDDAVNENGGSFVAWNWRASNATAVSNTAGSITSTVSANTSAGFSIVTYTGTGANATVGHGLGVAPKMIIGKLRNFADDWYVWHTAFAGTEFINLNTTSAKGTSASLWNSTIPTSTVFSLGTSASMNRSGINAVMYCFSEVAGYSKFGSYTGNGSSDGPFVHLGFRPKFVMIKCSTLAESWQIWDSSRPGYNTTDLQLFANSSQAESSGASRICAIDFTANGFKVRGDNTEMNRSGDTYVYACFAEVPTKFALAR